jgi:hypothetical protein
MKSLGASAFALLILTDAALAQHYAEPSDVSRATVLKHSFGSKKHAKRNPEKQRQLDAAHKAALSKIPNQPQPKDPWAKIRKEVR